MDLGLQGKVALVTAASKGLGFATADALRAEGVRVVICARGQEALDAAAARLGAPDDVLAIARDITDPDAPADLVAAAVEKFGRLDIVVPNAGGPPPGRALDVDEDAIARAINANMTTSIRLVQAAVPHMRAGGWGRICLITSSSVKQPIGSLSLSNVSRTALWAWAKTAATDLFADGITLNQACPGVHATDRMKELAATMSPDAMGDPADFGRVVAFLCSEPAGFITGTSLVVDGGSLAGL
ncbi:MAG TPA: SDR family oxidoreductase [Acidimicrobiales bacterium]|nr:SDR family oxidoreductase [Acidimicrobiales bacterium]